MDAQGNFFRSPDVKSIVLWDRLGGGYTWNAGFYYGLLTETDPLRRIQKGVMVGDAATCIKQTLMYDLPIVTKAEVEALIRAFAVGGGMPLVSRKVSSADRPSYSAGGGANCRERRAE